MIELGKTYRTRDGREVRIYAMDGEGNVPIHGAAFGVTGWKSLKWNLNGSFDDPNPSGNDLIEVKPKITRTYWLVIEEGGACSHWGDNAEAEARQWAKNNPGCALAITGPHEITFTEGDGL